MSFSFNSVIDQFVDGGDLLKHAERLPRVIELASGDLPDADADYGLVAQTQAGTVRRFPLHDAGNTLVSAIYFKRFSEAMPEDVADSTRTRINEKLASFGFATIPEPVRLAKQASAERFPLNSSAQVHAAAAFYEVNANKLDVEEREKLASAIVTASPQHDVLPGPRLLSETFNEWNPDFDKHIEARRDVLRRWSTTADPGMLGRQLDALDKIANARETEPNIQASAVMHALETFDRRTALNTLWGREVVEPWQTVYKQASVTVTPAEQNFVREYWIKKSVEYDSFLDMMEDIFGEDIVSDWRSDPMETFNGMLPPQRVLVRKMLDNLSNGGN